MAVLLAGLRIIDCSERRFRSDSCCAVGTVTAQADDGTAVTVTWDSGEQQAIFDITNEDLRVLRVRPGKDHYVVRCDGCKMLPLKGLRWKCKVCADYDLCSYCYNDDVHALEHEFLCIPDSELSKSTQQNQDCVVYQTPSSRAQSRKRLVCGILPGSCVVRGADWSHGMEDGGCGSEGTVISYSSCRAAPDNVLVKWSNNALAPYRLGCEMELRLVKPTSSTYSVYIDNLPSLQFFCNFAKLEYDFMQQKLKSKPAYTAASAAEGPSGSVEQTAIMPTDSVDANNELDFTSVTLETLNDSPQLCERVKQAESLYKRQAYDEALVVYRNSISDFTSNRKGDSLYELLLHHAKSLVDMNVFVSALAFFKLSFLIYCVGNNKSDLKVGGQSDDAQDLDMFIDVDNQLSRAAQCITTLRSSISHCDVERLNEEVTQELSFLLGDAVVSLFQHHLQRCSLSPKFSTASLFGKFSAASLHKLFDMILAIATTSKNCLSSFTSPSTSKIEALEHLLTNVFSTFEAALLHCMKMHFHPQILELLKMDENVRVPLAYPPYAHLELVGSGGCGTVFRAMKLPDISIAKHFPTAPLSRAYRDCAVKVVHLNTADVRSPEFAVLKREVSMNARLSAYGIFNNVVCSNELDIVPWLSLSHSGCLSYQYTALLFMDVADMSLAAWIKKRNKALENNGGLLGEVDYANAVTIIKQVANGIGYLHSHKPPILHGDLHLGNVLLSRDYFGHYKIQLTDFSNAKLVHALDTTVVRRRFAPVRSSNSRATDPLSPIDDIFALGRIMVYLLVFAPEDNVYQLCEDITNSVASMDESSVPVTDNRVVPVIRKMIECLKCVSAEKEFLRNLVVCANAYLNSHALSYHGRRESVDSMLIFGTMIQEFVDECEADCSSWESSTYPDDFPRLLAACVSLDSYLTEHCDFICQLLDRWAQMCILLSRLRKQDWEIAFPKYLLIKRHKIQRGKEIAQLAESDANAALIELLKLQNYTRLAKTVYDPFSVLEMMASNKLSTLSSLSALVLVLQEISEYRSDSAYAFMVLNAVNA